MRLIDNFMPFISYLVLLRQNAAKTQPEFQRVKADLQRLLSQSEACLKSGSCTPSDFDQARFIVCAWAGAAIARNTVVPRMMRFIGHSPSWLSTRQAGPYVVEIVKRPI